MLFLTHMTIMTLVVPFDYTYQYTLQLYWYLSLYTENDNNSGYSHGLYPGVKNAEAQNGNSFSWSWMWLPGPVTSLTQHPYGLFYDAYIYIFFSKEATVDDPYYANSPIWAHGVRSWTNSLIWVLRHNNEGILWQSQQNSLCLMLWEPYSLHVIVHWWPCKLQILCLGVWIGGTWVWCFVLF